MTVEERLNRIEHITAGLDEERRKDREENRQLWRDTQRQIDNLTLKIAETNETIVHLDESLSARMDVLTARMEQLAEESRAADQQLRERIDALVSAIGKMLAK